VHQRIFAHFAVRFRQRDGSVRVAIVRKSSDSGGVLVCASVRKDFVVVGMS
jgi:hypothetical protein